MKVAHPQSGSSSTWFLIKLEFGNVGFWGEGKTGVPGEKNLSEQRREPTTNSTHIWCRCRDMNPGHIGGRGKRSHHCAIPCSLPPPCQKQYFYPPMLALFAYLNMLICLFLFGNIQHPDHVRDDNYYVWTFCRLISVRSLFWSNLKLLKGRQTPVTFRSMETWLVNLIIFEIFIFVWQTYSSKPLVSHCDGMKRYSCRSDNSESNCWWKTGWLNRCHNCVHNWCSFTHTGCMAQVSFWLTRISNAHWKETLTFSFRSRLRFYSRYMYLLKSLQCTLLLNIS